MINDKPIEEDNFKKIENHFIQLNKINNINASPFEILTATAFTAFEKAKVKIGIVEVGMGGKLDATNILNNQAVCVISKIARDHEAFLGNTLAEIATHKAGILRPNVPYVVNPENEKQVQIIIDAYAKEIGAGPRLYGDSLEMRRNLFTTEDWRYFAKPLAPFQRDNAVLAIVAAREAMKRSCLGPFNFDTIGDELGKTRFESIPGRMQQLKVIPVFGSMYDVGRTVIADGAHNVDAAKALDKFVMNKGRLKYIDDQPPNTNGWPVTWVLAMTEGKDAAGYLHTLLKKGDKVITTSFGPVDGMPWVKPMDPEVLLNLALSVPGVTGFSIPQRGVIRALYAAKYFTRNNYPIVVTGSLYLMGDFYRELEGNLRREFWTNHDWFDERNRVLKIRDQEKQRVEFFLNGRDTNTVVTEDPPIADSDSVPAQRKRLLAEIEAIEQEIALVQIEEKQIIGDHAVISPPSLDNLTLDNSRSTKSWPSTDNPPPSNRPFLRKFKELRERARALRYELKELGQDLVPTIRMQFKEFDKESDKESDNYSDKISKVPDPKAPIPFRIRMHYSTDQGSDRRSIRRPDFISKGKWET
jgi:folylpolyglutamate synthase/dihydrofolate synthase